MNYRVFEIIIELAARCERKSHTLASILKWLLLFTYALIIYPSIKLRSRPAPDEVGSTGSGGDDDGAKMSERNNVVVDEGSPPPAGVKPTRAEPPFPIRMGEACNPLLMIRRRGE